MGAAELCASREPDPRHRGDAAHAGESRFDEAPNSSRSGGR